MCGRDRREWQAAQELGRSGSIADSINLFLEIRKRVTGGTAGVSLATSREMFCELALSAARRRTPAA
jgi:hypothetical protein